MSGTKLPELEGRDLCTFPEPTFCENITVRRNGHILFTTFNRGRLYSLDPSAASPEPELVGELPGVTALTGIAEVKPDVFLVTGGVKGGAFGFEPGLKAFTVTFHSDATGAAAADIKHVADIPGAALLNGMTALPDSPGIALSCDSAAGTIVRINAATGAVDCPFGDAAMKKVTTRHTVPIGINGVRVHGGHLYFTNSADGLFARVPITPAGDRAGDVEVVARLPGDSSMSYAFDDFCIVDPAVGGAAPVAYIATHKNLLSKVDLVTGELQSFFGGEEYGLLQHPTAAQPAWMASACLCLRAAPEPVRVPW